MVFVRALSTATLRCGVLLALSGDLTPQQLTARLRDADSLNELVRLHSEHGGDFNNFHVDSFWGGVKRLAPRQRPDLRAADQPMLIPHKAKQI